MKKLLDSKINQNAFSKLTLNINLENLNDFLKLFLKEPILICLFSSEKWMCEVNLQENKKSFRV